MSDYLGLALVIAFCAVVTVAALVMDRAGQREWRERLHRIDQIREGENQ